jgi:type II secretion system protein C
VAAASVSEILRGVKSSHIEHVVVVLRHSMFAVIFGLSTFLFRELLLSTIETIIASSQLSIEAALARSDGHYQRSTVPKSGDHSLIIRKQLFGAAEPKEEKEELQQKAPVVTPLKLRLLGTFLSPSSAPVAIIEHTVRKEQDAFEPNSSLFGEAKLISISNSSVLIERDGNRESLVIEEFAGGSSGSGARETEGDVERVTVAETDLDEALNNLPMLLTQARAVPYFKGGKAVGLRLFAIKGGSLFEKIGLRNGDVLKQINGNSLADFSQAMKLFEKLKQERSIKLELERNRAAKTYLYEIR